jgi:hypothetical protein
MTGTPITLVTVRQRGFGRTGSRHFADLQMKQPQHLAVAGYLWARVLVRRGINR